MESSMSCQGGASGVVISSAVALGGIPRYASVSILYNGQNTGMANRLKSLSYTDNSSGT